MSYLVALNIKNIFAVTKQQRITYTVYKKFKSDLKFLNGYSNINNKNSHNFHTSLKCFKKRQVSEKKNSINTLDFNKAKGELISVWHNITPRELSQILNKDINYIREIFLNQIKNADTPIEDFKLIQQAIKRSGNRVQIISKPSDEKLEEDKDVYPRPLPPPECLKPRPPVVTVMGHVDHGKTTLLDSLRHSSVVEKEFGGITQHIGAFSVTLKNGSQVTFLDTPGHAAFTAMRERGANITDIVVLVVAADDGVMEQTVESVKMAKRANVPILVAINKIDSSKANIDRTKTSLLDVGIQVEDLGGDVQTVPISALKKINLDMLTEALVLQAELLQVKADYDGPIEAVVVESRIDQHRGRLCTVIVNRGTLKKGAILVAGTVMARVRTLKNEDGAILKEVTPGFPAEIDGWKDLPSAGDVVLEVETEKRAREVIRFREQKIADEKDVEEFEIIKKKMDEHDKEYKQQLQLKRKLGRVKLKKKGPRLPEYQKEDKLSLNLIVKGDVDGTLEAILNTLDTYDSKNCEMDLVHYGVGSINETDIELAQTFDAIIYAFNVECPKRMQELVETSNVKIKHFNVIYKLVDDIVEEINGKLPPIETEEVCGEAVVVQQFDIMEKRKKIPTAGCRCTKGILKKSGFYKLVRKDEVIFTGTLSSLRHVKDEVETIKTNVECGLQLQDKSISFEPGDILVCTEKKLVPQKIDWDPGF